jgi:hypothetical protein
MGFLFLELQSPSDELCQTQCTVINQDKVHYHCNITSEVLLNFFMDSCLKLLTVAGYVLKTREKILRRQVW